MPEAVLDQVPMASPTSGNPGIYLIHRHSVQLDGLLPTPANRHQFGGQAPPGRYPDASILPNTIKTYVGSAVAAPIGKGAADDGNTNKWPDLIGRQASLKVAYRLECMAPRATW